MILDILVFVLGFLVAGLLALSALPAVWRRALRLSEDRLSRLVPLSAEEISAERDHLRAAHAVEQRRTELRAERAEADRAALRVEAARQEQRIEALHAEAARAQVAIAELEAERAELRDEVNGLWAESGAEAIALHGLSQLAEARLGDIAVLQARRDALEQDGDRLTQEVDRFRSRVAGLETRLVAAETRSEDLTRDLGRDLAEARRKVAETSARLAEREKVHEHEVENLKTELAFMAEQAASAERRTTDAIKERDAAINGAERQGAETTEGPVEPTDEDARLRKAVAALAGDILRVTQPAEASMPARVP